MKDIKPFLNDVDSRAGDHSYVNVEELKIDIEGTGNTSDTNRKREAAWKNVTDSTDCCTDRCATVYRLQCKTSEKKVPEYQECPY